jgi:hypothetical protein
MGAKTADLRQEVGCRPILRELDHGPGAGRVVAGEDSSYPG